MSGRREHGPTGSPHREADRRDSPGIEVESRASGRRDSVRVERKARTRATLVEAALTLSRERGFSALSLRDIARAAGISPTAFYRHFSSLDDLGITLAEEGMRVARGIAREIRRRDPATLSAAMEILGEQARAQPDALRFVVTERYIASAEVRRALGIEIRFLAGELAIDLARRDDLRQWDADDLTTAADLILSIVSTAVAEMVEPDVDIGQAAENATRTLRMAFVGLTHWRSRSAAS